MTSRSSTLVFTASPQLATKLKKTTKSSGGNAPTTIPRNGREDHKFHSKSSMEIGLRRNSNLLSTWKEIERYTSAKTELDLSTSLRSKERSVDGDHGSSTTKEQNPSDFSEIDKWPSQTRDTSVSDKEVML